MDNNRFTIKKGHNTVSKTFRLPTDMVERLEKLAKENNISVNSLVIQCISFALDNLQI